MHDWEGPQDLAAERTGYQEIRDRVRAESDPDEIKMRDLVESLNIQFQTTLTVFRDGELVDVNGFVSLAAQIGAAMGIAQELRAERMASGRAV